MKYIIGKKYIQSPYTSHSSLAGILVDIAKEGNGILTIAKDEDWIVPLDKLICGYSSVGSST